MNAPQEFREPERQKVIRLITSLATPGWIPEDVAPDVRLVDDLGFDSVRLIELTMALERAFGLPPQRPENLATITTVDDVVSFALTTEDPL
ncbi:phosphopantetheine-binding protein [Mycobacterium sp. NPDC048908]|uniref:phosphopantetheine-binding protein n=1 Tax=Mycobacterium sp. NPDC048908 TaxID=3364292 RepID=UPI003716F4CF